MTAQEQAQRVAEAIAALGDPQKRREFEARTNQQMRISEVSAEERHRSVQAQRVK